MSRVIFRFTVSRMDEQPIRANKTYLLFSELFDVSIQYSRMNKKTIYIHIYYKSYSKNPIVEGINMADLFNDTYPDKLAVLDLVIINNINYSYKIDEYY
jgi:hypothetical protein